MYHNVRDFERIETIINNTREKYIDNAFQLQRIDSERLHKFVIRCKSYTNGYMNIVFDSVEQFEKFIHE